MDKTAGRLTRALTTAGVLVEGVSIGDPANRATWKVQPANLQAAAQPIIDAFNPADPALETAEKDAEIDGLKAIQALARATHELKSNAWTLIQFRDRIKTIYRAL